MPAPPRTTATTTPAAFTAVTPPSPASAISYTWDNSGDLTARGSDSFGWDYEDRMTSATVGGTGYAYTYRGDGLRNSATTAGVTKTFTWDINAGLPVVLDDGAQYIYGNGLVAQVSGATAYYYLSDGLGSTLKTTDASGNVVNAYTYDVYGKTTSSSGSQANDVQFAGQQTDPTGFQYLRARYYDPETSGFLSRDPLSAMPGWSGSPFRYAGGDPANRVDPSGLMLTGTDDGCGGGCTGARFRYEQCWNGEFVLSSAECPSKPARDDRPDVVKAIDAATEGGCLRATALGSWE